MNCGFVEFVPDLNCGFAGLVGFGVFIGLVLSVGFVPNFGVCGGAEIFRAAARVPLKKFAKKFFKIILKTVANGKIKE